MKKVLSLMVGILMLFSLAPSIMAQDCENKGFDYFDEEVGVCLDKPGITAQSPFWFIDKAAERLTYSFKSSPDEKAKYILEILQERDAEITKMIKENASAENMAETSYNSAEWSIRLRNDVKKEDLSEEISQRIEQRSQDARGKTKRSDVIKKFFNNQLSQEKRQKYQNKYYELQKNLPK